MDILEGLNDAQAEAVQQTDGPLLILAGAGSGKTKTLTHRIAYLIQQKGIWPDQILAVTFTNKAAREMRERLWRLVDHPAGDTPSLHEEPPRNFMRWMGTFHGVCVRLLKIDGAAIGIDRNFVIYDEDDRQGLVKQAMKSLSITDKSIKPRAVSSIISNAKNELVTPAEFEATASYPFQKTIAKLYAEYERLRVQAGALDFDDLLIETVRLLRDQPEIRHKWQQQFRYILIDEYQDTNAAQYAIVKSLVSAEQNISVVGDDWQSIYSWRGADFTNILNFERDFPTTKIVKLEQNYRSTGAILEAAHTIITKNVERSDKKLWTAAGPGAPVQITGANDEAEEAHMVASRISAQVAIGARSYDDFAVLYRTNAQSAPLERAFMQLRVPYQIVGGVRFYDRREVKDVIAYLRLIYQPRDTMSFSRIVNVPTRGIGATSLEKFLTWQSATDYDVLTALSNVEQTSKLTPRAKTAFMQLSDTLRSLQAMVQADRSPVDIIEQLVKKTGYDDYIQDGTPQAEDRAENVGSLLSDAALFSTLGDFLDEVALMSSADTQQRSSQVTLMTIHAAKGLEFPVVCMVGLEEGILPHARVQDDGPRALEEERRLCYVGMTRAREELHMSYAYSRLQFGQRSYNTVSRFLEDLGGQSSAAMMPNAAHDQHDEWLEQPSFDVGDRVRSVQFGDGEIIDVDGLAVTVQFDRGQTKKLNIEYARLSPL